MAQIEEIEQYIAQIKKENGRLLTNYYNNFRGKNSEINYVREKNAIVFWGEEMGIQRVYFSCSDENELSRLLTNVPSGAVLDIISKNEKEMERAILSSGMEKYALYGRMSNYSASDQLKKEAERNIKTIIESGLYKKENTFLGTLNDVDFIMNKLKEVFDPLTAHLCTVEELCDFIKKEWVFVYKEHGEIKGFYIVQRVGCKQYGYQIWNGTGVEAAYSLNLRCNEESEKLGTIKYGFSWVDMANKKAIRFNHIWGNEFDGLYDVVYKKGTILVEE